MVATPQGTVPNPNLNMSSNSFPLIFPISQFPSQKHSTFTSCVIHITLTTELVLSSLWTENVFTLM